MTDVDLHGHVNNAVHWQAVEDTLPVTSRLQAELDYRQPLDLEDELELAPFDAALASSPATASRPSPSHAYLSRSFSRRPSAMARPTTVITAR